MYTERTAGFLYEKIGLHNKTEGRNNHPERDAYVHLSSGYEGVGLAHNVVGDLTSVFVDVTATG